MNEEECEKALENLRILERKDNFKKWGGQVAPQINCDVVERLIKEHFDAPPYRFDELKINMWVWDDKFKDCMKIKIVFKPCKLYPNGSFKAYHDLNEEELNFVEFEEGRFFPPTKAMEYQE